MATKITPIVRISPPAKGNIWADGKFDAMLTSSAIARSLYLQAKDAKESDPWGRGVLRKHQTNEWKEVSPTSAFTRVEVPELHGLMLAFGGFGLVSFDLSSACPVSVVGFISSLSIGCAVGVNRRGASGLSAF